MAVDLNAESHPLGHSAGGAAQPKVLLVRRGIDRVAATAEHRPWPEVLTHPNGQQDLRMTRPQPRAARWGEHAREKRKVGLQRPLLLVEEPVLRRHFDVANADRARARVVAERDGGGELQVLGAALGHRLIMAHPDTG